MTREEASFVLANIDRRICDDELNEALDIAIMTLEQKPCEDAVSRKFMYELGATCIATRNKNGKLIALGTIENLPSVTPIHKIGKWIKVTNGRGGHECNICHNYAQSFQNGDEHLTKYCPNCGAEMQEVEHE